MTRICETLVTGHERRRTQKHEVGGGQGGGLGHWRSRGLRDLHLGSVAEDGDDLIKAAAYSGEVVALVRRVQSESPTSHVNHLTGDLWFLRLNNLEGRGAMCFTI